MSQWVSEIDITCLEGDRLDRPFTHFTYTLYVYAHAFKVDEMMHGNLANINLQLARSFYQ